MASLLYRRPALLLWTLAAVTTSCTAEQVVLANDAPGAQISAIPSVVDYYKQDFAEWAFESRFHKHRPDGFCTGCDQAPGCCVMGGWLVQPGPQTTLEIVSDPTPVSTGKTVTVTQLCDCSSSSTPDFPAPTYWAKQILPTTILSSSPIRETIFRNPATSSTTNKAATPTPALNDSTATPSASPSPAPGPLNDLTQTYYDFTLEGHHPFVLPLILLDNSKSDTPITLLATASTTHPQSFISSSLVSYLNRTSEVSSSPTDLTPAQITQLLGFITSTPGAITLDVLAGKNDRRMGSMRFVVFEPSTDVEGPWGSDISVGLDFLNEASAIRLSDEFVGVGAREGLGVVVQKVYGSGVGDAENKKVLGSAQVEDMHTEL